MFLIPILLHTKCFTNFGKLNLVEFTLGGLVLGSSQFLLLPQMSQKMTLASKEAKSHLKKIVLLL